jgi:glycosyltransferase involved in cell wall biosynthesis
MSTLLSIIIPTYNAATCIKEAIESILSQTFHNYEILVMDGLSSDHTVDLVKSLKDERIRIYSEKDQGIYDAMNKGIDLAEGEWLYFLGSDDKLFDRCVLEKVAQHLLTEIDVLYGQVLLNGSNKLYGGEFNAEKLVFSNISHQALFMRKRVFDNLGKFDLRYKICADHIFNVSWFFNPGIRKQYVNMTIAVFSQQGVSSTKEDWQKVRDLPGLVKKHAGITIYTRLYMIRPLLKRVRKQIAHAKNRIYTLLK